ncbi:hypothetical protein AAF712_005484 [Marasmius tenuissimus]|uniref:Uncharacterized protein n=1 Tax=Marasmius tenuissimus TaxID=585030 RepID=A0ABR3A1K2_9AGAR
MSDPLELLDNGDRVDSIEEDEVNVMLGLSGSVDIEPAHYMRRSDAQHWIKHIQGQHEDNVQRLQREHNIRAIQLEYEVLRLQDQLSLWRKFAVTVVEGTDRAMQNWMGHLNDAVRFEIDEVDIPELADIHNSA